MLNKGKYPIIRVGNFYTDHKLYYSNLELDNKYYLNDGDLLYTWSATFGPHIWHGNKVIYHYHIWKVICNSVDKYFLLQLLNIDKNHIQKNGSTMAHITKSGMEAKKVNIPSLPEQRLIGRFFAKLDKLISLQQSKLTLLKKQKRGYLQKLFPQKNESMPRIRFDGFHDKWHVSIFKNLLNYEQPNKYRVKNDHYLSKGIPVLTANKAFVLGYTNENNFYDKGNCIIFDDFTLDNKYVDFPFMIKSSAMKILTATDESDLYFDYELLNVAHLIHEGHKRHYISVVQNFRVLVPSLSEQRLIGQFFKRLDDNISLQNDKLNYLRKLKKAYLQKMFC